MLTGWSKDVVLCTDGPACLGSERAALERAGVRMAEEPIRELTGRDGRLQRIEFLRDPPSTATPCSCEHSAASPTACRRARVRALGGGTIVTDGEGRTGIPGVYAAGDAATESMRSVANAMGTGARVAQGVALDLVS